VALMSEVVTAPFILGQTLLGSIGQLLVRKLCPKCREKYEPPKSLLAKLGLPASHKGTFYRAKGCKECFHGYKGRIAIHEVFGNSGELRELLGKQRSKEELREFAAFHGMKTFVQDGVEKAAAGLTSIEEVLRVADVK
jgi:type II secretory ATPase GspE/PulE/Tfp pilus assembly ATPase PilB-like protein